MSLEKPMNLKKLNAFLFLLGALCFSTITRGQVSPGRSPSVEPVVEVDIEDVKNVRPKDGGYNFDKNETASSSEKSQAKKRVPANITTNPQAPSNYLGPIIFLITLPFALWLMVSKKFTSESSNKSVDYFPKTHQFKPFKTDYQASPDDEDDDVDFPKAS